MDLGAPTERAGAGPAEARGEADPELPTQEASGVDRQCRYCLGYAEEEGVDGPEGELVAPCGCTGGQRWVHLGCLRRWQRSVLVTQPTHPTFYREDVRTTHCGVCTQRFRYQPPSRHELMAGFTGAELAALVEERTLICASQTFSAAARVQFRMSTNRRSALNFLHWCQGVYLIYYAGSRQVVLSIPDEENRAAVLSSLDSFGRLSLRGRVYHLSRDDNPLSGYRRAVHNGAAGGAAPDAAGADGEDPSAAAHAGHDASGEATAPRGDRTVGTNATANDERSSSADASMAMAGDADNADPAITRRGEGGAAPDGGGRLGAEWVLSAMRGASGPPGPVSRRNEAAQAAAHDLAAAAQLAIAALRLPAEIVLEADQVDPADTSDDTVRAVNLSNNISHLDLAAEARRQVKLAWRAARQATAAGGRCGVDVQHHLGGPCGSSRCTVLLPVGGDDGVQFPLPVGFRDLPQLGFAVGTDLARALRMLAEARLLRRGRVGAKRHLASATEKRPRCSTPQPGDPPPPKRRRGVLADPALAVDTSAALAEGSGNLAAVAAVSPSAHGTPRSQAGACDDTGGAGDSEPCAALVGAEASGGNGGGDGGRSNEEASIPAEFPGTAQRGGNILPWRELSPGDGSGEDTESLAPDASGDVESSVDAAELAASPPSSPDVSDETSEVGNRATSDADQSSDSEDEASDGGNDTSGDADRSSDIEDATAVAAAGGHVERSSLPARAAEAAESTATEVPLSPAAVDAERSIGAAAAAAVLAGAEGSGEPPSTIRQRPLLVFWGEARWQRTQLLGELARGDWGLCRATASDLSGAPRLWQSVVVRDQRPVYAPRSEMSRQHAFETPAAHALLRRLHAAYQEAARQQEEGQRAA